VSTETVERPTMAETAQRVLESLADLEREHSDWLEALDAQYQLEACGALEQPEEEDGLEEERETVRLYLAREAEEYGPEDLVSEDRDPVMLWLESVLDLATIWESRGSGEPERRGWELLLGYGGPSIGLELGIDGRATVWAAHWSPTERAYGRLDWLANYLEELGL